MNHSRSRFVFRSLTVHMAFFVVSLGLELYVRFIADTGMHFDLEMWRYARALKQVSDNSAIGHEHRPGSSALLMGVDVHINQLKLRDEDYSHERPSGTQRVLMLGDSITFGWGVPIEETVSKRLERFLREAGRRVDVINAGVGNYNTTMEVEYFFTEGYKFDPQLIVLNYFINDAEPVPIYRSLGFFQQHAYSYIWLTGRVDVLARQLAGRENWWEYYLGLYDAPGWKAAEGAIDRLAEYCKEKRIGLLIVNYPELRELESYRFDRVRGLLEGVAARNDTGYLDLYTAVRNEDEPKLWVTKPDPHPNGYAHKLFADALLPVVDLMLDRSLEMKP